MSTNLQNNIPLALNYIASSMVVNHLYHISLLLWKLFLHVITRSWQMFVSWIINYTKLSVSQYFIHQAPIIGVFLLTVVKYSESIENLNFPLWFVLWKYDVFTYFMTIKVPSRTFILLSSQYRPDYYTQPIKGVS